jgi:hypothetical protein
MPDTELYEQFLAFKQSNATNLPVKLKPLSNGVTSVIMPNGVMNNFSSEEKADAAIKVKVALNSSHK